MILIRDLKLGVEEPPEKLRALAAKRLRVREEELEELRLYKRSLDARKKPELFWVCSVLVSLRGNEENAVARANDARVTLYKEEPYTLPRVAPPEKRPVVVGFGHRFPQQPDVPKREADENGTTYVFIGWRSSLDEQVYKAAATVPAATANATYTATYQEDPVEEVGTTILGFLASVFARMNRIFEQIAKVFEDWKAMLDKMF